ncbi:MAG: cytochrome c oxidase subunit [Actinomycetota bacterium]|jgi:cytochrome c oxidase subunit 1|nr:cytochrome c oxidase subunit [Actinomycetota bacterium]
MTLTEAPPEQAGTEPPAPAAPPASTILTSADHKTVGRLYIAAALLFLLAAGVVGMIMRVELAEPGVKIVGSNYARLFSLHSTVAPMLFLAPFWTGLATVVVPLQLGAPGLAFPRLQSTSLWLYVVGGGLVFAGYIVNAPHGAGLVLSSPISGKGNHATDLWIMGLLLVAVASVIAAGNLLTTIVKLRAPGMTLQRVPLFAWSVFATSAIVLLATPVFIAGLFLLYLDQHFGGVFFAATTKGSAEVWQHSLWLYGRPEIYLLALPGLGAACDIVATAGRGPLPGRGAARAALVLFAFLSLGAWAADAPARAAVVVPTTTWFTGLVIVPVGILALLWLGAGRGFKRFHLPLLHVAGAIVLVAVAVLNVIVAAAKDVDGGTAWAVGHLHVAFLGAPLLLAIGAAHHWAPKLVGRRLSQGLGALELLLVLLGTLIMGGASYVLGYDGAPWHVANVVGKTSWTNLERAAAAGGGLVSLGVVLFVLNLLVGGRGKPVDDNPYGGITLEWATSSPPPPHNFDTVPVVRSEAPLAEATA